MVVVFLFFLGGGLLSHSQLSSLTAELEKSISSIICITHVHPLTRERQQGHSALGGTEVRCQYQLAFLSLKIIVGIQYYSIFLIVQHGDSTFISYNVITILSLVNMSPCKAVTMMNYIPLHLPHTPLTPNNHFFGLCFYECFGLVFVFVFHI